MSSLCNIHEVTILAVSCSWMNSASDIGTFTTASKFLQNSQHSITYVLLPPL